MHYHSGHFWNRPRPTHFLGFIGFALMGLLFAGVVALLFGFVLMVLWNWLMPAIFSLPLITFWQAWGLVVLSHIFFKSSPHHFRHPSPNERWKRKFHDRFWQHRCHEEENEKAEKQDA